jgi:hypothetical protein
MVRKLGIVVATVAISTLGATLGAAPASAHSAAPCDDSGEPGNSDYAAHHIVALAHDQALGDGGHKPGSHAGFSLCLDVH